MKDSEHTNSRSAWLNLVNYWRVNKRKWGSVTMCRSGQFIHFWPYLCKVHARHRLLCSFAFWCSSSLVKAVDCTGCSYSNSGVSSTTIFRMIKLGLLMIAMVTVAQVQGRESPRIQQTNGVRNEQSATDVISPQAVDCNTCKTFMAESKQVLETSFAEEFDVQVFSYFCKEDMGDFSDLCKQLFKTYFNRLRELVVLFVTPSAFCPALKFCTADEGSLRSGYGRDIITHAPGPLVVTPAPSKCENCKEFYSEVVTRLKDPAYEKPIVDLLKTFCVAGCASASICIEAANEYGTKLLSVIGSVMKADNMCQQIGACPPPSTEDVNSVNKYKAFFEFLSRLQTLPGTMDLLNPGLGQSLEPEKYGYQSAANPALAYPDCDACRWYMNLYNAYLKTKVGEQLVFKVSSDVCKVDAGIFKGLCQSVIKTYRDALLQIIENQTKPQNICPLFAFCPAPTSSKSATPTPTPTIPIGYKPTCDDCKSFMMKMQTAWKNPATQVKLINHFSSNCVKFCAFKSSCTTFFDVYAPSFFDTTADEALDPEKACTTLTYCPTKPSKLENRMLKNMISPAELDIEKVNSTRSVLCKSCLSTAEQMEGVFHNTTKGDIGAVLTKFCFSQSESLRLQCYSLADKLKFIIEQQGIGVFKLGKICHQLSVCMPV